MHNKIKLALDKIPADLAGGCSIEKAIKMADIIVSNKLKIGIEIGVHRGRSLVPIGIAFKEAGGFLYGIDPYSREEYKVNNSSLPHKNWVPIMENYLNKKSKDLFYYDVLEYIKNNDLENFVELIRKTSQDAIEDFKKIELDFLHIDGNHAYERILMDLKNYTPLIKKEGFLVLDDISWTSVKNAKKDSKIMGTFENIYISDNKNWEIWRKCK